MVMGGKAAERALGALLLAGLAWAALARPVAAAPPRREPARPQPIQVKVVALQATIENRPVKYFDAGAEDAKRAVADLEFDTYRKLNDLTFPAPFGEETARALTAKYTLAVTPQSEEPRGQVRLNVCIRMAAKDGLGKPVNAITTTLVTAPGAQFKLRGLQLDQGELVVVVTVKR